MDVFGKGFKAYLLGDDRPFVILRDDGFEHELQVASFFTGFGMKCERDMMNYVRGRVLDIGCGAGRVALWLQLRGFDVTGIDLSPTAVEVCKLRGLTKCSTMGLEDLDFPPASFDTALLLGDNLALGGTVPGTVALLRTLHTITSPDARLIGSGRDPIKTENPMHLAYHQRNRKEGKLPGQLRLRVRFGDEISDWYDFLLLGISELNETAEKAGWKVDTSVEGEEGLYSVVLKKG